MSDHASIYAEGINNGEFREPVSDGMGERPLSGWPPEMVSVALAAGGGNHSGDALDGENS